MQSPDFAVYCRTGSRGDRTPTPAIRIRKLRTPRACSTEFTGRERSQGCQAYEERDEIIATYRRGEYPWPVRSLFVKEGRFKLTKPLTTRFQMDQSSKLVAAPNKQPPTDIINITSGATKYMYHRNQRPFGRRRLAALARCANRGPPPDVGRLRWPDTAGFRSTTPPSHVSNC